MVALNEAEETKLAALKTLEESKLLALKVAEAGALKVLKAERARAAQELAAERQLAEASKSAAQANVGAQVRKENDAKMQSMVHEVEEAKTLAQEAVLEMEEAKSMAQEAERAKNNVRAEAYKEAEAVVSAGKSAIAASLVAVQNAKNLKGQMAGLMQSLRIRAANDGADGEKQRALKLCLEAATATEEKDQNQNQSPVESAERRQRESIEWAERTMSSVQNLLTDL